MHPRVLLCACWLIHAAVSWAIAQPRPREAGSSTLHLPHQGNRISVAFAPDGRHLATGGLDNGIHVWPLAGDVDTPKPIVSIVAHSSPAGISRLAYFPDGKKIASGSWLGDGTVKIWHATSGKELKLLGKNDGGVSFLGVSPTGKHVAWGSGGTIHLYDVARDKDTRLPSVKAAIDSVAFSPDGKLLASANGGGMVRIWNVDTGEPVRDISAGQTTATGSQAVAFSPDGKTLATAGDRVRFWTVTDGMERASLGDRDDLVFYIAYSPDGRRLAAATFRNVILFDVATRREVRRWIGRAMSVAFSPDGKRLAFGRDGGATVVKIQ